MISSNSLGKWLEAALIHSAVGFALDAVLVFPARATRTDFLAFQAKHQEVLTIPKSYVAIAPYSAVLRADLEVFLRDLSSNPGRRRGLIQACAGGFKAEDNIDEPVASDPVERLLVALATLSDIPLECALP